MTERAWRPITIGVVILLGLAAVLAAVFRPEQPSALAEGWTKATVNGGDGGVMTDVVAVSDGFLAVGHVREGGRYTPALWKSKSGHDWDRVERDAFGVRSAGGEDAVITATYTGGKLTVAAGHEAGPSQDGPIAVWVSDDEGQTWDRLPHDEEVFTEGRVGDLTTAQDGSWIAVGSTAASNGRRGQVWRSPDGRVWELLTSDTMSASDGDVELHVVTSGGDGLVALGSVGASDDGSEAPLWTSSDGVSWRQVRMPADLLDGSATVRDAISWRQEGMMVAADEGPTDASAITVLSRLDTNLDDGTAWTSTSVSGAAVHATALLDAGDGHIFLVGWATETGQPTLAAWSTKDGQTFEPISAPGLDAPDATPNAVTTNGTNTVIVGSSGGNTAAAWVHGQPG